MTSSYPLAKANIVYDPTKDSLSLNALDEHTGKTLSVELRKDTEEEKSLRTQLTKLGIIQTPAPVSALPEILQYPTGRKPSPGYYDLGATSNNFITIWDTQHDETALLISGEAGTGKTNLIQLITRQSEQNGIPVTLFTDTQSQHEIESLKISDLVDVSYSPEKHQETIRTILKETRGRTPESAAWMIVMDNIQLDESTQKLFRTLLLNREHWNLKFAVTVDVNRIPYMPLPVQDEFKFRIALGHMDTDSSWSAVKNAQAALSEHKPGRAIFSREDFADYYPVPFQVYKA